jgi:hypothetical protein
MNGKNLIPNYIMRLFQDNPRIGRYELAKKVNISEQSARQFVWLFKKMNQKKKVMQKGVVLFDIHYPEHDKASTAIALDFIKDFKPDLFIFGGDQMDMGCISTFNRKKPMLVENKRLAKEYEGFQHSVLDVLNTLLPSKCKRYWITGNHEQRVQWLIESLPQWEGFIEPEKCLDLSLYKVLPFGETINLGEMVIAHGVNYGLHHSKKNVQHFGTNIFTGHVHTSQVFTMNSPVHSLPRQGVSVGCLCNKNPEYKNGQPNAWIHQFLVFWIFDDGSFAYEIPTILNNQAIICGKHYHYKEETNTCKSKGTVCSVELK